MAPDVQAAIDHLRHELRLSRFPTDDVLLAFHALMKARLPTEQFTQDVMRELISLPMTATGAVHFSARHPERYSLQEVARFADLVLYLNGLVESFLYGVIYLEPSSPLCERIERDLAL